MTKDIEKVADRSDAANVAPQEARTGYLALIAQYHSWKPTEIAGLQTPPPETVTLSLEFTLVNGNRFHLGEEALSAWSPSTFFSKSRAMKLCEALAIRIDMLYTFMPCGFRARAAAPRSVTDLCVLSIVIHPKSVVVTSTRRRGQCGSTPGRAMSGRSQAVTVVRSRRRLHGLQIGFNPAWAQMSWRVETVPCVVVWDLPMVGSGKCLDGLAGAI